MKLEGDFAGFCMPVFLMEPLCEDSSRLPHDLCSQFTSGAVQILKFRIRDASPQWHFVYDIKYNNFHFSFQNLMFL